MKPNSPRGPALEQPGALALKAISEPSTFITGTGALTASGGVWPSRGTQSSSGSFVPPVPGLPQKTWRDFPESPVCMWWGGWSCLNRGLPKGMGLGCRESF